MSSLLTGLVSYYALEGNGDDALNVNDGTPNGNVVFSLADGYIGEGSFFLNTSAILDTATTTGFPTGAGTRTTTHWFRTTSTTFQVWLQYGTEMVTPNQDWAYIMDGAGLIGMGFGAGGGFFTAVDVNDGQWHFIVATYDGTTASLYVDNVLAGTNVTALNTVTTTLKWMRFQLNNSAIDEVGIWNRVLTTGELDDLWNAGAGLTYPFSAPVAPTNASFLFNIL